MASSRKSLSDFIGLSWSSWSNYAEEFTHSDGDNNEDNNETHRKSSGVMRLYSSDMQKFGLFPETDCFCTVVCSECGALVKPQGLLTHMRVRHKELVPEKVSPEKLNKIVESTSIKGPSDKASVKHVLNEKLMSKLVLNEKHSNKSSNDKLLSSFGDKHKSNVDKSSSKYTSSDKTLLKCSDKLQGKIASDKAPRLPSDKLKASSEKCVTGSSLLIDKSAIKNESDRLSKSVSDSYSKQTDVLSNKTAKLGEKQSQKSLPSEKFLSKYVSPDKVNIERGIPANDRTLLKSSEKISVKSVLSEKLLSKAAASDKGPSSNEKNKSSDYSKSNNSSSVSKRGESLLKADRIVAKPVMKSLLKDKALRNEPAQSIVPGSSLLRPLVHQERESTLSASASVGVTTLSPPVLMPQNLTPECHQSVTDMPVLSRKRKYRERKAAPTQYDPDRHCGVWCDYFNKFCVRSLTCKVHSVALRRAVVGRSKPFDQLLIEHRRAKEDQRQSREDQDEFSESSPQLSDRLHSPSDPSSCSFVSSPYVSPATSPMESPCESNYSNIMNNPDEVVTLCTPSTSTGPPIPLPSYQYPPYPPSDSDFMSPAETLVNLSPHLNSPLLNVALPSLSPSHAPRPPDSAEEDSSKYPRTVARALNRFQQNKGKQFNVKHTAFPPKPLRTCLFQGRKTSGMFVIHRELESMRSGFRFSVVKGNKSLPVSHLSLPGHSLTDTVVSHSTGSTSISNDPPLQVLGMNTSPQVHTSSGFKSVLGTLCTSKAPVNREGLQRMQRPQKNMSNGPEPTMTQPVSSDSSMALSSDKLSQSMRFSVPTTVPQQITYLTTTTPVTFQQVPIINSQVLSQLQLQSKGSGGTLKLLSTGGGGRTLLLHQYQDGSGAES